MTQWVRLWEDMPTDPKWRIIAKRSGRPACEVVALFTMMLTNASVAGERGSLESWDDEAAAVTLDMEEENVASIRLAMQGKVLDGDRLMGWGKRQPKREDASADRVRAFRERAAELKRAVTHGNAPETTRNAPEERRGDPDPDPSAAGPRASRERELELNCRKIGVELPVVVDPNFTPVLVLLETDRALSEADTLAAMRSVVAKNHRLKSWASLEPWIRRAAKDRLDAAMPPENHERQQSNQTNSNQTNGRSRNEPSKSASDFLRAKLRERADGDGGTKLKLLS